MVEKFIKNMTENLRKEFYGKNDVSNLLCNIRLFALLRKNKIGWIHYPENTDKHIKNKHLFWNIKQ